MSLPAGNGKVRAAGKLLNRLDVGSCLKVPDGGYVVQKERTKASFQDPRKLESPGGKRAHLPLGLSLVPHVD